MTRKIVTALAMLLAVSGTAKAEFLIDNFRSSVEINNGSQLIRSIGNQNLSLEVTAVGASFFSPGDVGFIDGRYSFGLAGDGATVSFAYTWSGGGTFDSLQSISGLEIEILPADFSAPSGFGGWNLAIDGGAAGRIFGGDAGVFPEGQPASSAFPGGLSIDDATSLTFTYTYDSEGGAFSFGSGNFGRGINGGTLIATPEPSALAMVGVVGVCFGLNRRRRS